VLADKGIRLWLGFVEGRPVSCSTSYLVGEAVGVDHVATRPDAWGRGYGAAVAWQATGADPTRPALLEASELGRPIYARLGYRVIAEAVAWSGRTGVRYGKHGGRSTAPVTWWRVHAAVLRSDATLVHQRTLTAARQLF